VSQTPERQYYHILTAKGFSPTFFTEDKIKGQKNRSASQALFHFENKRVDLLDDGCSDSSSSTASFKLNEEGCIGLFNGLKALGERGMMTSPERRAYFLGLQNINLVETE